MYGPKETRKGFGALSNDESGSFETTNSSYYSLFYILFGFWKGEGKDPFRLEEFQVKVGRPAFVFQLWGPYSTPSCPRAFKKRQR